MQTVKKALLKPLSHLYIAGVRLRHWLFDHSYIGSTKFEIPVVCVGNITVGGTGKSPMSEMLLSHLAPKYKVAILSRGYGRKSRGYIEVQQTDDYLKVGDEPLQIKMKFPEALVVVCEKRVEGVQRIMKLHPDTQLIIMDDGFQHRYITPRLNIIMMDAQRPISNDQPLPLGSLRDTPEALQRADFFVVTKCPEDITAEQIETLRSDLTVAPHQRVYFSRIVNIAPVATYLTIAPPFDSSRSVIAMAGIGNPTPFTQTLDKLYNIAEQRLYPDHYSYTSEEISKIASRLEESPNSVIVTTEKDSVKFLANNDIPQIIKERLYYTPIRMQFIDEEPTEILKTIESYVK